MPNENASLGQSGGIAAKDSTINARDMIGGDNIQVAGNLVIVEKVEDKLAHLEEAKKPTPLSGITAALEKQKLADQIARETAAFEAKLEIWPRASFSGEDVIPQLLVILQKAEGDPEYCQNNRPIWATLYRMIGGSYILHSKLQMREKLSTALPYLHQSHEIWPQQEGFQENIAFFEKALREGECQIRDYSTNLLQILRGPRDPEIPALAEALANAGKQSPELQAKSWLLNQATPRSIWSFLEALQMMIKTERNIDAEIEVETRMLLNGHVEVDAAVGPNKFAWEVDPVQKTYECRNDLTKGFMGIVLSNS
ncbi:MAG TPA: hypothetical protein VGR47_09495 [Terracidiphilus sp.]|nr:hypothetical protein [Terracidiphilus sp.]